MIERSDGPRFPGKPLELIAGDLVARAGES